MRPIPCTVILFLSFRKKRNNWSSSSPFSGQTVVSSPLPPIFLHPFSSSFPAPDHEMLEFLSLLFFFLPRLHFFLFTIFFLSLLFLPPFFPFLSGLMFPLIQTLAPPLRSFFFWLFSSAVHFVPSLLPIVGRSLIPSPTPFFAQRVPLFVCAPSCSFPRSFFFFVWLCFFFFKSNRQT